MAHAAPFGVESFDGAVTANDTGDVSFTQAGGHPYAITTSLHFNTDPASPNGDLWPTEPTKDVFVDVPPGLVGNPTVAAQCSLDQLVGTADNSYDPECPAAAQIGVATLRASACPEVCVTLPFAPIFDNQPIYNMVPPPNFPARFAFIIKGSVVTLDAAVRTGSDYGLSVNIRNVSEALPILSTDVTLWGTPAEPSHDAQRWCPGQGPGTSCTAGVPPKAFLTSPTSCQGPQTTTARIDSWFHPGVFQSASFVSHQTPIEGGAPQGGTGCDQVPFDAALSAKPDESVSPGPSGWAFDLTMPQTAEDDPQGLAVGHYIDDPSGIAESHLKKASVTLPANVRVSPSSADGLGACSPAQIALHSTADPTCPDASKVGTVTIDTPLLSDQLEGAIYLAKPHDNPSNSLIALYLVAKGPGLIVKLPGSVAPNGSSGQLSATFDNNPQLPFSHLHLHFFGGDRAALSNPPRCGTYTTTSSLTSWSGKTVESDSSFTTSHDGHGAPCPALRFKPLFSAGTTDTGGGVPSGGATSSFDLNLSRTDDDEEFAAIKSVNLPGGLLARVASVPLCTPAKVALGTCGEASRVGSVTTSAGPGPDPFAVHGRVYLGGPYKGAPFSLSIVVPVIAGPFDLGTVVVRSALDVDPATAKISVVTDPLPTILQGIPLQIRLVNVTIDRKGFMVNPTSCNPKTIGATVESVAGTVAHLSTRFQVASCASLPLGPRMRIGVGSKGHTGKGVSTPLTTTITQPPHQAGLRAVSVTLPSTLNALLPVVNNACTQAAFDAGHCEDARAGTAVAVTPLLRRPLKGGVYFVKDPAKPAGSLPNLVVALRGQVDFNLVGQVKIPHGKLLSTHFSTVPDVPIKKFTLHLVSGSHGPLGTAADLCTARSKRQVAKLAFRGQNGKLVTVNQRLKVHGCTKHSAQGTRAKRAR